MTVRIGAVLVFVLLAAACGGATTEVRDARDDTLLVVATMSVLADLVEAVGGEQAEVRSLVPIGGDPHSYEPRPSDAADVARADLVVDNGLGLSPWFETSLVENVEGRLVRFGDEVPHETVTDDRGRPDPHLWLAPSLAKHYVELVADAFVEIDGEHAEDYRSRAERAKEELDALSDEIGETLATVPRDRRLLVTHEDAFNHFANEFGFEVVGTVVGATTEEEPSAQALSGLIDIVRERGVVAVFPQVGMNQAVMERVARDAGVTLGRPLHVDSLGEPGSAAETYEGMLRENADIVASTLGDDDG